jgi:hypothetical protein
VQRNAAMAAGIGWTRGVLDQAGLLGVLTALPAQLRLRLQDGTTILGVHASPGAVAGHLRRRRHPNAGFRASVLTGRHQM